MSQYSHEHPDAPEYPVELMRDAADQRRKELREGAKVVQRCRHCSALITQLSPSEWVDDLNNKAGCTDPARPLATFHEHQPEHADG